MENKQLKEVYSLYEAGKYKEANDLNNDILEVDPNNIYSKRYVSLLSSKIKKKVSSAIPKVKGKQLSCPSCLSKISFTGITEKQQKSIKSGDYNNLELKCPYCHINFVLQSKKAKSILGLKLGEKIQLEGKEYRITGYVEYDGRWIEGKYSGGLKYLEWILLGDNNSYKYFSEGKFEDDGYWKEEFEFSEKYIPVGSVNTNSYKEKNIVTVNSVYGENAKSFIIGEEVEILDFGNYVLEKEGSGSQREAGFYNKDVVSKSKALKIFGKAKNSESNNSNKLDELSVFTKVLLFGLIGLLSTFLIFKPIFGLYDTKTSVKISDISDGDRYIIEYGSNDKKIIKTKKYDYGGVRTYFEQKSGIKFSVKNTDDNNIINNIIQKGDTIGGEILEIKKGNVYIVR